MLSNEYGTQNIKNISFIIVCSEMFVIITVIIISKLENKVCISRLESDGEWIDRSFSFEESGHEFKIFHFQVLKSPTTKEQQEFRIVLQHTPE